MQFSILFFVAAFLFFPFPLFSAGLDSAAFLLISPGARTGGMGESSVSIAEGADAISVNPSGLSQQSRPEISFQHLSFVEGILYHTLSYLRPTFKGGWSTHIGYLGVKKLNRTVADTASQDGFRELEEFSTYHLQLAFSFARKVGNELAFGSTLRFIRESLSDASANGASFDLGFLYKDRDGNNPLQFGFAFQHLGPDLKFKDEKFSTPKLLRGGFAIRNPENSNLTWIPHKSIFSAELLRFLKGDGLSAGGGIEIPLFSEAIFFRGGYHYPFKKQALGSKWLMPYGLSSGIGLQFNSFQLDYALNSMGELGFSHRVSLKLWLGSENG